jgi:hypothetical protein
MNPAHYDMSTLRFGAVRFGTTLWTPPTDSTSLDEVIEVGGDSDLQLDVQAQVVDGEVRWHLTSIDPLTGELPEDPFRGFLPPNSDGTEGQGVLYFDVQPKALPEGTVTSSQAEIIFDLNAPILTNTWQNLIDGTVPTATATSPAESGSSDFVVTWSGNDAHSGVASMDVFVAVDGAGYSLWQQGVAPGSATYSGAPGHTYRFSAMARDHTGNTSLLPPLPHATTVVLAPPLTFAGSPSITGTPTAGKTLGVSGIATNPAATSTSYQWRRDGADIAGATAATYRLGAADVGRALSVRVTATRSGYRSAVATTDQTPRVARMKPSLTAKASSPAKRTALIKVTVKAGGSLVRGAKITIKEGRKTRKRVTLRKGTGSIKLTRVPSGRHTYSVVFATTSTVSGKTLKLARLRVR